MIDVIVFAMKYQKRNRTPNRSLQKSALFTSKLNSAFRRAPATLIGGSREKEIYSIISYLYFFKK